MYIYTCVCMCVPTYPGIFVNACALLALKQ